MAIIKKHDFVEIEYTGRLKDSNKVFDTTDEKTAKDNNLYNESYKYGPAVICIGEEGIIRALDNELVGKETGKSYKIEVSAEKGFGKKNPKLLRMVSIKNFKEHGVAPMPGLQVNIDNVYGTVVSATSGRVMVDFNHPLAGKDISYDLKVNRIIDDDKEKLKAYLKLQLGKDDIKAEIENGKAKVKFEDEIPEDIRKEIEKKVKEIIPNVNGLEFEK